MLLSDGKGSGRPARLELTKDSLTVQMPLSQSGTEPEDTPPTEAGLRSVTIKRDHQQGTEGGLGVSIKVSTVLTDGLKDRTLVW